MYSVEGLDQDTVNKVLDEFLAIIKEQTNLGLGAGNYIQNVLNKALKIEHNLFWDVSHRQKAITQLKY